MNVPSYGSDKYIWSVFEAILLLLQKVFQLKLTFYCFKRRYFNYKMFIS